MHKENIIENSQPTFWFGDEPHRIDGFFRTAALRYCIALPLLMVWSHTLFSIGPYVVTGLWFLGGGWLSLRKTICSSWMLLALLPLIIWTFAGLFSDGTTFKIFHRYFSLYTYCFIFVFAALLKTKESRAAVISSISLALLVTFCWGIAVHIYYSGVVVPSFTTLRKGTILYLFRHSIGCSIVFVLWGGLWCCFPYSSRHIGWCKRVLPKKLLDAMESAADISFWKLCMIFFRGVERRCSLAVLLSVLRWFIIIGILVYLFGLGNSRTAQAAIFVGYSALLLKWNWRKGLLIVLFVLLPFCMLVGNSSRTFDRKATRTYNDIIAFWDALGDKQKLQNFAGKNRDRLGIWASVYFDMFEKPFTGLGIDTSGDIVLDRTEQKIFMTHSELVFLVLERGFIALGCFLLWWFVLLGTSLRNKTAFGSFGLFLALLIMVNCLFNNAFQDQAVDMYLIMLAVLAVSESDNTAQRSIPIGMEQDSR
ncbi:MAG: hypothetical protein FWE67_04290 [Planctomycetaceae bacterium]|nr:hypothetical protein [Planctomycetaceae bacterium]